MNYTAENEILTLFLSGRVDSSNSDAVCADAEKIIAENAHTALVIDAGELEYISSAGLRVILRIRKSEPTLRIINVTSDIYEIFEMTGFSEMIPIEKAYKELSVDGCEIIGEGAKGIVYRYNDDTIVKVYKNADSLPDIQNERKLARCAFVLGIPTAMSYDIVKVGESYGSVFELLSAKSYSEMLVIDPDNRDKYISDCVELLKKIHSTKVKADDMPDMKIFVRDWLKTASPFLEKDDAEKLSRLIEETPDTSTMLHCDFHTNNVMNQNGETLLIDMDTLSHGHPVFELANMYITYVGFGEHDPSMVEKFLKLPYDTAKYIWDRSIALYLGTEDKEKIAVVENKAKLIAYLRLARHFARRGDSINEKERETIKYAAGRIRELIDGIDTLDF